jgi:hypothetical protein
MAGAGLPLEVVGDIMRFVGAPPPAKIYFTASWRDRVVITAHPTHYEVETYLMQPTAKREVWPRSDETAAFVLALVRAWLVHEGYFTLTVTRGIITDGVSVFELEFDGSVESWNDGQRNLDDGEYKTEGDHYLWKGDDVDEPLPKHFMRMQELYSQKRARQLVKARLIGDLFLAAATSTHY